MVQTYSNNNKIYSVDMMFAYIQHFKPESKNVLVDEFLDTLEYYGWGDPSKKIYYSALDVINNPKKYSEEFSKITGANLKYPIIVHNGFVIDGVHRLSKAWLNHKKYIKAYEFDNDLMKKFLINKDGDWKKVDQMEIYNFIDLYFRRFC